jgi:hypothetical protein
LPHRSIITSDPRGPSYMDAFLAAHGMLIYLCTMVEDKNMA